MKTQTIPAVAVVAASLVFGGAVAWSAGLQVILDRTPTADELIKALTPEEEPPLTRGIRPTAAAPVQTPQEQMPAVALNVGFEFNSAAISPSARDLLQQLGTALRSQALAPYVFMVEGHTDSSGGMAYNMRLSERRAQSVKEYLVANFQIPNDRLVTVGKGPTSPLPQTPAADGKNRRVEIRTVGK
jgi:outer membrane protein OmpA-like peptidoglycan-associated protein